MAMGLDPATQTIIGMAMQGLGTLVRKREEDDMRDRQMSRYNEEAGRQDEFSRQGLARVRQATEDLSAPKQKERDDAKAQELENKFAPAEAGASAASFEATNPGAPKEISDTMAAAVGRALAKGKSYAKSTAALSALNRGSLDSSIAIGRSAQDLGRIGNASQGSWNVMNQDINAIRPNTNSMALSDLSSGIGGMFAMQGMRGAAKPKVVGPWGSGPGTL